MISSIEGLDGIPEKIESGMLNPEVDIAVRKVKRDILKNNSLVHPSESLLSEKKFFSYDTAVSTLLNQPGMTANDNMNMEKSIQFLLDTKKNTLENLKKLEAVRYTSTSIEIGGIHRTRENLKADPNGTTIFNHGDETYFKFDALKEQDALLAQKGMKIPGINDFIASLQALPGNFLKQNRYAGGNILGTLLGLPKSGGCHTGGKLFSTNNGYMFSSSTTYNHAWFFGFNKTKGKFCRSRRDDAFPVRPIFK